MQQPNKLTNDMCSRRRRSQLLRCLRSERAKRMTKRFPPKPDKIMAAVKMVIGILPGHSAVCDIDITVLLEIL